VLYAGTEGWEPSHAAPPVESRPALDRWVLARLHQTLRVVTSELDAFDFHSAARELETLLGDVSDWYIRRSRRRFWKPLSPEDQRAAFATLHEVLVSYAAALAPFCPFVTDHIWTSLTAGESVHLSDYPVARDELIDESLLAEMQRARRIVETGLAAREEARINARKPLAGASVSAAEVRDELVAVICDELNLKSLRFTGGPDSSLTVALDTTVTEELRLEGLARELVRRLQVLRKKAGLRVEDRIEVRYRVSEGLQRAIATWEAYIRQEVLAEDLSPANGETGDGFASQELQFDGESAWLALRARG
jgi:isoleucyl-tRNA synthetase